MTVPGLQYVLNISSDFFLLLPGIAQLHHLSGSKTLEF